MIYHDQIVLQADRIAALEARCRDQLKALRGMHASYHSAHCICYIAEMIKDVDPATSETGVDDANRD